MSLFRDERRNGTPRRSAPDNDEVIVVVYVHLPMSFYVRSKHLIYFRVIILPLFLEPFQDFMFDSEDNFQEQSAGHFPKSHHQVQGSLMYQLSPQGGSQFQKAVFLKVSLWGVDIFTDAMCH